jgi:hypothetical protein
MDIKILGPGCKNCVTLDRITREAVKELGIKATIEKVEDCITAADPLLIISA